MNETLAYTGLKIETNTEYTSAYLETILSRYVFFCHVDENDFVYGKRRRKSREQRYYEKLNEYLEKLKEYVVKLKICGPDRNSCSKTDHAATFMRIKKDYMGNDRLLPAYNIQIGVANEYIAVVDVMQHRSDMDCFVPLMEKFYELYGLYPKYPTADAGHGSFNNYLFCQEKGMEKYMKFPMYRKETKDEKYHNDPFRAVNFKISEEGRLTCPNGKAFHFSYRKQVKGNPYGRQEEYDTCEDCSGCPYAEKYKKRIKTEQSGLTKN